MFKSIAALAGAMMLFGATSTHADATIPGKDIANARDNTLLKRYEGSFIVSYEKLASPISRCRCRSLKRPATISAIA